MPICAFSASVPHDPVQCNGSICGNNFHIVRIGREILVAGNAASNAARQLHIRGVVHLFIRRSDLCSTDLVYCSSYYQGLLFYPSNSLRRDLSGPVCAVATWIPSINRGIAKKEEIIGLVMFHRRSSIWNRAAPIESGGPASAPSLHLWIA